MRGVIGGGVIEEEVGETVLVIILCVLEEAFERLVGVSALVLACDGDGDVEGAMCFVEFARGGLGQHGGGVVDG